MAGVALEIAIDDSELRAMLERAENIDASEELHAAWDAIGEAMVAKTQMRFHEQHGPDGAAWPPSKAAIKEGRPTLIKTARLLQSMAHNLLDNGVEWGTNVIYAAVHQFGATFDVHARNQTIYRHIDARTGELGTRFVKKRQSNFASEHASPAHSVTIPARPFLGIDDDDIAEAESILARHVEAALIGGAASFVRGAP
jgi:phage virion morphogenesis protein